MISGETAAYAEIGADVLRRVMGCFPTGVTVVTASHRGERHGMTLNSLTSVSLDPPLVLVCLHNDSRTLWAVEGSRSFAISFLAQGQEKVSNSFARRGEDHFGGAAALEDHTDPPLIRGRIGHLICAAEAIYPGGDHQIALGRVIEAATFDISPLVFYRGGYHKVEGLASDDTPLWYW